MITKDEVTNLTAKEKDTLILQQEQHIFDLQSHIKVLESRICKLEEKFRNKKTSKNSSLPPSKDWKETRSQSTGKGSRGRNSGSKGYARELYSDLDKVNESKLKTCLSCGRNVRGDYPSSIRV